MKLYSGPMEITPRLLEARPTEGWNIWLRYEDGLAAEVDFETLRRDRGVFEPLRDPAFFRQVAIYPGRGSTIFWPNEADVAPETLYRWTREAAGVSV